MARSNQLDDGISKEPFSFHLSMRLGLPRSGLSLASSTRVLLMKRQPTANAALNLVFHVARSR